MDSFSGKTAFVTGGASGIGLAMAQAFLQQGMNVVIADVDKQGLAEIPEKLGVNGDRLGTVVCDVGSRDAMREAAQYAVAQFGNVHILCNNAGVGAMGPVDEISHEDWQWVINTCQWGVIHGIEVFLPHMKSHGEACHIVNTASLAGLVGIANMSPYCVAKYAVVAISECLNAELQDSNIGVSVLCPGVVRTRIFEPSRTRLVREELRTLFTEAMHTAIEPAMVAAYVLECIRANELYIFTHAKTLAEVETRFAGIKQGYDRAKASPVLRRAS